MGSILLLWFASWPPGIAQAAEAVTIGEILQVEAGATCLSLETLVPHVEEWLHDRRIGPEVRIEVMGSPSDSRHVRLRVLRDGQPIAERAFEPGPALCSHLHGAVGLAIAMALKAAGTEVVEPVQADVVEPPRVEAGSAFEPDAPQEAASPSEEVLAQADASPSEVPRQLEATTTSRSWSLSVAGLVAHRVLPGSVPGLQLAVRRALGESVSLRAGVLALAAYGVALPQDGGRFDAALIAVRGDGCVHATIGGTLRGAGCAGVVGGALRAAGTAVMGPASAVVGWYGLASTAELEWRFAARWSLALGLSLLMQLNRVSVGLVDSEGTQAERRTLDRVGLMGGLGVAYFM